MCRQCCCPMQHDSDSYVRIHTYRTKEDFMLRMYACVCVCMRVCVCVSPVQVCMQLTASTNLWRLLGLVFCLFGSRCPLLLLLQLRSLVLLTHLPFIVFSFNRQLLALKTHAHTHAQCRGDKDTIYTLVIAHTHTNTHTHARAHWCSKCHDPPPHSTEWPGQGKWTWT